MNIPELEAKAMWVRRKVLEMAVAADSGHVSTACSQTEILVSLYHGGVLRHDPANPKWDDRDVFLLSKGQGGIGLYPVLADRGYFPVSDLDNFCGKGSRIGVHAEWHCPGIEMISGSLGHGLPVATGIAQALKNDGKDSLVFCLCGDGELHEGSNWEAMMSAAQLKLDNLILLIDRNGQNTIGRTRSPMPSPKDGPTLDPLRDKLEAFGFRTSVVDGHSLPALTNQLKSYREFQKRDLMGGFPHAVICNTVKGRGLSVMEDQRDWHYRCPRGAEVVQCAKDLGMDYVPVSKPPDGDQTVHGRAMRDRYFDELYKHFQADKNCVLITADNGWPGIDQFAALPGQFYQVGIAESQMVGMAAGMALRGKKVWCYAIAPFVTTRVHEFLKLDACAMNLPVHMIGVGAGFAYSIMCVTHHQVEDIAIMRALPNMTIYSPADGHGAALIAKTQADEKSEWFRPGPSYVRLDRGGIPDIYSGAPYLTACMSDIKESDRPLTFVSTGYMTHTAYKLRNQLGGRVLDVTRIKPLDNAISCHLKGWPVVTLEEHQMAGGLGSAVVEFMADRNIKTPLLRIGVPDRFSFELGGREEIHKACGLDLDSVVRRIREWIASPSSAPATSSTY